MLHINHTNITCLKASAKKSDEKNNQHRVASSQVKGIFLSELALHKSEGDCWISIHGKVYDVSEFHSVHPGGDIIMEHAGMEAGDQFEMFHHPVVHHHLRQYFIGNLIINDKETPSPCDVTIDNKSLNVAAHGAGSCLPCTKEYRELRDALWKEGAFDIDHSYFINKMVIATALIITGILSLIFISSHSNYFYSPIIRWFISPLLIAIGMQQSAFVAHDTQHNGVVSPRGISSKRNIVAQVSGGVFVGISVSMWLKEHNEHHLFTMRPSADPHFDYKFMWLQSLKEVTEWKKVLPRHPVLRSSIVLLSKFLIGIQHLTVLPLALVVGRYAFLFNCWVFALRNGCLDDIIALTLHFCWYLTLVCSFYSTLWERVLFVFINYIFNGVLHIQLLLSHFCYNMFTQEEELSLGVFQFQLLTTRNVKSYWWNHWFHGGLELQIEHHLFPMLPRHKLREVKPRVQAIAKKYNIPYVEVGFFEGIYKVMIEDPWDLAQIFAKAEFLY